VVLNASRGSAAAPWLLAGLTAACSEGPSGAPSAPWSPAMLVRRKELDAKTLCPDPGAVYVYDARAGLLLVPDHTETWEWEEHAEGRFRWSTNNLGLLETQPTEREKHGLRILVTGDSHLMVTETEKSFPNAFESELRRAGYEGCEVLDSGVGYTGPRLYLRRIERFLELQPDVVIVSFFTGNDFWDDLLTDYDVLASPKPALDRGYARRLTDCQDHHAGALYQGLNQAHFFKHWPGTAELAYSLALASLDEIHALCRRQGMALFVVLLPTKIAVDVEDEPDVRAAALASLALSEEDAAVNVRLGERLARELAERGIPTLDPTAEMRADPRPFYWRRDHHLATSGHLFVAQAMLAAFEPELRKWKTKR